MRGKLPFVERRVNKGGEVRWYWRRPGYALQRLPDDDIRRYTRVAELNTDADQGIGIPAPMKAQKQPRGPRPGTIAWYIRNYERSGDFTGLASSTRKNYSRQMRDLERSFADLPIRGFTRRAVKEFLDTISTAPLRRVMRNVLLNLFERALDDGVILANPARGLRLPAGRPRRQLWDADQITAFWKACDDLKKSGPMLRLAFALLLYTGQRIGDVLAMRWSDFDGDYIHVVQEKTGAKVAVYCHRDLKVLLEEAKERAKTRKVPGLTIVALSTGEASSYNNVRQLMHGVIRTIGSPELQTRDLRRTAVTRLAEVGCSESQIASITGHGIEACRRILDTYLVRTPELSRTAIQRWEAGHKSNAVFLNLAQPKK